jgi:hypothetical protein
MVEETNGVLTNYYRDDRVTGGNGEDVSAGHGLRAYGLDLRLDVVDDAEALRV